MLKIKVRYPDSGVKQAVDGYEWETPISGLKSVIELISQQSRRYGFAAIEVIEVEG